VEQAATQGAAQLVGQVVRPCIDSDGEVKKFQVQSAEAILSAVGKWLLKLLQATKVHHDANGIEVHIKVGQDKINILQPVNDTRMMDIVWLALQHSAQAAEAKAPAVAQAAVDFAGMSASGNDFGCIALEGGVVPNFDDMTVRGGDDMAFCAQATLGNDLVMKGAYKDEKVVTDGKHSFVNRWAWRQQWKERSRPRCTIIPHPNGLMKLVSGCCPLARLNGDSSLRVQYCMPEIVLMRLISTMSKWQSASLAPVATPGALFLVMLA